MRSRLIPAALAGALLLPHTARAAANKEHQQLMAEIRMLQEQQQQLQAMIGTLGDAVKALSTKIDDQTGAMRKGMADQALTLNNIGETTRVLREKMDDTNVRVSSVSQEIAALRQAIASASVPQAAPAGAAPGETGTEPGAPTPAGGPPPAGTSPGIPLGQSPQRAFEASMDDYMAGRYDLAVKGFDNFIDSFPTHPRAAEARFDIGQSYFAQQQWDQARDAFQRVISDYPQSPQVPDAYFKLGQSYEHLNQLDLARKAYETVVATYPPTTSAVLLARQALERISRK
jgi:tol-pal system protein YbgF